MPAAWRKVIVSGSTANLANVQVDSLASGQAVIGGGASNLTTRVISGSGAILASGGSNISLTGSFSGSLTGSLFGTASFASNIVGGYVTTVAGTTNEILVNGGTTAVGGAVTISLPSTVDLGAGSSLNVQGPITASFVSSSQITGSLLGTASYVTGALFTGINQAVSASFALTSSFSQNAFTASFVTGSIHTGTNPAATASFVTGSIFVGANQAVSSSFSSTSSFAQNSFTASFVTGSIFLGTNSVISSSFATTASFAQTALNVGSLAGALTPGAGLSGTSATYNGSTAVTFNVGQGALITVNADDVQVATSSLFGANTVAKVNGNAFAPTNITDDTTTITLAGTTTNVTSTNFQIGTNKLTVASATGNTTIAGTLSVTGTTTLLGDLIVNGTASFQSTENVVIRDRFISLASGSNGPVDAGILIVQSTLGNNMTGSAFYLEAGTGGDTGTYGRFAVAPNIHATASNISPDEYMVTAKINAGAPVAQTPTWGGNTNNAGGNIWIDTTDNTGGVYIWA